MSTLPVSKLSVTKQITADEIETLMKNENLTVAKAAKRLDISPATVRSILGTRLVKPHRVRWDEENIKMLEEMVREGMSRKDIAQAFDTTEAAISYQISIHRFQLTKDRL